MKNLIVRNLVLIGVLFFFSSFAFAAEVLQGKCLSFDETNKTVTIEEYDLNFDKDFPYGHPTGIQAVLNIGQAEIGAPPQPGDILRVAYVTTGQEKKALKVMNVSRQKLTK